MRPFAPRASDEDGFTLIELMVVVLIIAILISLGLPTYFGARDRANERAVQSNIRNGFTAARVYYNESLRYTTDVAQMLEIEPSLLWTTSTLDESSSSRHVSLRVFDQPETAQTVVLAARTATGKCFYLRDVMGGTTAGTYYDRDVAADGSCPIPDPSVITNSSWTR